MGEDGFDLLGGEAEFGRGSEGPTMRGRERGFRERAWRCGGFRVVAEGAADGDGEQAEEELEEFGAVGFGAVGFGDGFGGRWWVGFDRCWWLVRLDG